MDIVVHCENEVMPQLTQAFGFIAFIVLDFTRFSRLMPLCTRVFTHFLYYVFRY